MTFEPCHTNQILMTFEPYYIDQKISQLLRLDHARHSSTCISECVGWNEPWEGAFLTQRQKNPLVICYWEVQAYVVTEGLPSLDLASVPALHSAWDGREETGGQ